MGKDHRIHNQVVVTMVINGKGGGQYTKTGQLRKRIINISEVSENKLQTPSCQKN